MKEDFLKPAFVEFIPEKLDAGVVYISQKYGTATHLCCCGCGKEVVTPLGPTDWSLRIAGGAVTLYPSIGNWSLPCRSHYWIRGGRVIWAAPMTQQQINSGRMRDQRQRDAYFAEMNSDNEREQEGPRCTVSVPETTLSSENPDWSERAWMALKRWLG